MEQQKLWNSSRWICEQHLFSVWRNSEVQRGGMMWLLSKIMNGFMWWLFSHLIFVFGTSFAGGTKGLNQQAVNSTFFSLLLILFGHGREEKTHGTLFIFLNEWEITFGAYGTMVYDTHNSYVCQSPSSQPKKKKNKK